MSLDALRGFDMFWIIGGYELVRGLGKGLHSEWLNRYIMPQIEHTPWAGFTAWDLIMPLFLFVVGAAMPFSFAKRLDRRQQGPALRHILTGVVLWTGDDRSGRLSTTIVQVVVQQYLQAIAAVSHRLASC
jgi:predicted acyltransferase